MVSDRKKQSWGAIEREGIWVSSVEMPWSIKMWRIGPLGDDPKALLDGGGEAEHMNHSGVKCTAKIKQWSYLHY